MNKAEKGMLFFLLLAVGCGQTVTPPVVVVPPVVQNKPTTLILFGAGFCTKCKAYFPLIDGALHKKENLLIKMYLVAGDPSNVQPTQEMADAYAKLYSPNALPIPDLPWRWTNFRNFLPLARLEVPAAVVLNESHEIIKTYTAGETTFQIEDIISFVGKR